MARDLADLDLLDLALALEVDFSVVASELRSGKVRTYGELTDALLALAKTRVHAGGDVNAAAPASSAPSPFVWARIVPANDGAGGVVHAGALDDDAVQTITAAALAGGRGTTVEVTVAAPSVDRRRPHADASARWQSADTVAAVDARLSSLAARGIVVTVRPHQDAVHDTGASRRQRRWSGRVAQPAAVVPKVAIAS